jgi:hypothetical protein
MKRTILLSTNMSLTQIQIFLLMFVYFFILLTLKCHILVTFALMNPKFVGLLAYCLETIPDNFCWIILKIAHFVRTLVGPRWDPGGTLVGPRWDLSGTQVGP